MIKLISKHRRGIEGGMMYFFFVVSDMEYTPLDKVLIQRINRFDFADETFRESMERDYLATRQDKRIIVNGIPMKCRPVALCTHYLSHLGTTDDNLNVYIYMLFDKYFYIRMYGEKAPALDLKFQHVEPLYLDYKVDIIHKKTRKEIEL